MERLDKEKLTNDPGARVRHLLEKLNETPIFTTDDLSKYAVR